MSEINEEVKMFIEQGIICATCQVNLNDIVDEVDVPGYPRNCAHCDGILESEGEL